MADHPRPTTRPQLSIANIFLWMTSVAFMLRLYGPYFQSVADLNSQDNVVTLQILLGMFVIITATQFTAAIALMCSHKPPTQSPGAWLLCLSLVTFAIGLPVHLREAFRDWIPDNVFSGFDYWVFPITFTMHDAATAAILYASVSRGRMLRDGGWWQTLIWLLCLWNLFAATICAFFLWRSSLSGRSADPAVFAFSPQWNWIYLTVSSGGTLLAILSDLKTRIRRDGYHWCGAVTFGLTSVWTILYRLWH